MSIKDGEIASSDEVMNAMGSIFNDAAQNLFNADYIGFDSRLYNSGVPNLKNVKYSTFTSDDADVNGFMYDSTDDLYSTAPIIAASVAYIDIYATDVNVSTLTDSANGTYCFQLDTGVWRIVSSGASTAEAISRIFYQLFFDLADAATDPNGVTTLTDLRCSESDYRGQLATFTRLYMYTDSSGSQEGAITLGLSGASTYKIINDWCTTSISYGPNINATSRLEAPTSTVLHTVTINNSSSSGWDDTESSTIHSVASTTSGKMHHYASSGQALDDWYTDKKAIWVIPDSVTPTYTVSGTYTTSAVSDDIAISSTAPDTTSYPLADSTLIFKDTVTNTDHAIPVINSTIDAASSEQISVSADGGSNWTDVDNAEIARPIAGTALWRRIVITRTDLSVEDTVTEQAVKYNFY